jgi:hypothetical protein
MKNKLFGLLSVLVLASLVLSACGSPASEARLPLPMEERLPPLLSAESGRPRH